ncbi:hypothetical protein RM545_15060 [Zunongwangia sp. F260]|uniref:Beta-galactosidase n=1 Tax=Autumnicola lenta TaxID=3075593 RepID=A0ABU3CP00_9FLAO|nr:hypothetical protein [Zunongwangia sp. F260]MDT0648016.1 hypothetical protein [Zunongwangia sp. F260]
MKNFYVFIFLLLISPVQAQEHLENEGSTKDWFSFTPENTYEPGVIGMNNWLDAPAGNHGFLQIDRDILRFEDGTKFKLWGTNISSRNSFVDAKTADDFANYLAKFGMNAVRFHKFSWYAYDGEYSTRFDSEKFKRFDYFQAKLREKGIYYGWSHIYGHRVQPGDSTKMLAYDEIRNLEFPWSHLDGSTASLVNFAPDLQELSIALTVDMLNHINPHTGLRYADDPGLAFIEFQNEDNIFWSAIELSLKQAPTYKALLNRQFSEWLQKKYGSQSALEEAWGKENIPKGESLSQKNIYPQPNHSLFSGEYESALKEDRNMVTHILDKMRFLYETQVKFYKKFEKAVRATGYKGVLVASCWQAGSGISHFYNLHADYQVGMIDRHNYFGGGEGGHRMTPGAVKNQAMVSNPGSGLLSTGLQQVVDRPFFFSEWMSLVPNQWTAEAAPIIAAYGMGLQGWDASFSFGTDIPSFSDYLTSKNRGVYNATSPLHTGLYPALARMVLRNDVKESPVIATRNVHVPSLIEGELGFEEKVDQGYDDKRFSGSVSPQTMAIGKIPVNFTQKPRETVVPDLSAQQDTVNKIIHSITGELSWWYGENKYFTINTPGTKGAVGFLPKEKMVLDKWELMSDNPFAVILITSLEQGKNLNQSKRILVTAVARGKNTGMLYNKSGDSLIQTGDSPLLLEPVNFSLRMPGKEEYSIEVLDHNGLPTGNTKNSKQGKIEIKGRESKSIWYLIEKQ